MSPPLTKKRKPSTFDGSHTPSKRQRNQPKPVTGDCPPARAALASDGIIFSIECPVRSVGNKGKQRAIKGDVFGPKKEDGGFPNLNISYAIRPGKSWTDLRTYRNFTIQDQKFTTGSLIYINKHEPPPDPPDSDASEAEVLAFDKENLWVGKVLEVKAANTSEVWLRVFWLYWPEELPRGRQKYHGNEELIMSNHMEIVDAKTVASRAEINYWDEKVEDQDVGRRFWRQFYDVQLEGTKTGGLSTIRRHCLCNEFYNPDKMMLKCPNPDCGIWNHQECLEERAVAQTYGRLSDDQTSLKGKVKPSPGSEGGQLRRGDNIRSRGADEHGSKGNNAKTSLVKTPRNRPARWTGLLKAEIIIGVKVVGDTMVKITDERGQDPEVWMECVWCLKCGTRID